MWVADAVVRAPATRFALIAISRSAWGARECGMCSHGSAYRRSAAGYEAQPTASRMPGLRGLGVGEVLAHVLKRVVHAVAQEEKSADGYDGNQSQKKRVLDEAGAVLGGREPAGDEGPQGCL